MATMTLRGVDDALATLLKSRAAKEGLSVNAFMLKLVKESLGVEKRRRNAGYDDLDHLAGTWSAKDALDFERVTALFEAVDEDLWK